MTTAYLNGEFLPLSEARISPLDRGFLFGDGIYEVIPSYAGKPIGLKAHLKRLSGGLSVLGIDHKLNEDDFAHIVTALLQTNLPLFAEKNIGIYLHVSRGADINRAHAYPINVTPTIFGFAFAIPPPQPENRHDCKPLHVALSEDLRWKRCHIKSTSLLGNVMHYQHAATQGLQETILYNDRDEITEASSSNVFIVKSEEIITPPLDNQLLPGITRQLALEAFKANQLPVNERVINKDELLGADEVWLSSSTKEIVPVVEVGGSLIGGGEVGRVWEKAIQVYHAYR